MTTVVRKTLALSVLATLLQFSMLPTGHTEVVNTSMIVTEPDSSNGCPANVEILTAMARTAVTGLDTALFSSINQVADFDGPDPVFSAQNITMSVNFPLTEIIFQEIEIDPPSGVYTLRTTHTFDRIIGDPREVEDFVTAGVP